jgi:hypothetical protein
VDSTSTDCPGSWRPLSDGQLGWLVLDTGGDGAERGGVESGGLAATAAVARVRPGLVLRQVRPGHALSNVPKILSQRWS